MVSALMENNNTVFKNNKITTNLEWIQVAKRSNSSNQIHEGEEDASPCCLFILFKVFNFDCEGKKQSEKCHCAKVSRVKG